jgi:hypothetical protein
MDITLGRLFQSTSWIEAQMLTCWQEEQLLFISHAFNDLGSDTAALCHNMDKIATFAHSQTSCHFIFLLQMHVDPSDGSLHFATNKSIDFHKVNVYLPRLLPGSDNGIWFR